MKAILVSLISVVSLGGCMVDDVDSSDEVSTSVPRLASNALTPAQLNNSGLTPLALTQTQLDSIGSTADGRAALSYAVGCALPAGTSVTVHAGLIYTYQGQFGIAPNWQTTALSTSDQKWVSSCVLARINKFGTAITLSMRATSSAFATTSSELTGYQYQEGAFWGNVFKGASNYYASCSGAGQAVNPTFGDMPNRRCAVDPGLGAQECGFNYAGPCSTVCTTTGGVFAGCTVSGGTTYAEVATSFLYGTP